MPQTLFGSTWGPVDTTAAVLRAAASRHGARLQPADHENLAAAVATAELLTALTNTPPTRPQDYRYRSLTAAASALLARAAGHNKPETNQSQPEIETPHPPQQVTNAINQSTQLQQWLHDTFTTEQQQRIWKACAQDLNAGASHKPDHYTPHLTWLAQWAHDHTQP